MPQEENKAGISRRDFLKDAGLVVGGATVGSMAFLSACGKTTTTTVAGPTVTTTSTLSKFVDPIDGTEWPTLTDLQNHFNAAHPGLALSNNVITLNVNGVDYNLWVKPTWPLAYVLRDKLGFNGVKVGCDMGQCGSCTILVDGVPMFACLMLAIDSAGHKLMTVEGLSDGVTLNPLQQKFVTNDAYQCGYCTPGILMTSTALLATTPKPTADQVRAALAGHICMCANWITVVNTLTGGV
jgi:aerobic-type carbon monoxide dehydrogenase small subunit (CoxS/CutS family)